MFRILNIIIQATALLLSILILVFTPITIFMGEFIPDVTSFVILILSLAYFTSFVTEKNNLKFPTFEELSKQQLTFYIIALMCFLIPILSCICS